MRILHQMLKTSSVNFGYVLSLIQMNGNEVKRRINMTLQFHGKELSEQHVSKLEQILDKVSAHGPDMIQLHDVAIDNLEYLRLSGKSEKSPLDTDFFWLDLDENDALDPFVDEQPAAKKRGRKPAEVGIDGAPMTAVTKKAKAPKAEKPVKAATSKQAGKVVKTEPIAHQDPATMSAPAFQLEDETVTA